MSGRQALLDAGYGLLEGENWRPFYHITREMVAKKAKVSGPLINHHFITFHNFWVQVALMALEVDNEICKKALILASKDLHGR